MANHLGYDKGDRLAAAVGDGNHRNGTSPTSVATEVEPVAIDVPRDLISRVTDRVDGELTG